MKRHPKVFLFFSLIIAQVIVFYMFRHVVSGGFPVVAAYYLFLVLPLLGFFWLIFVPLMAIIYFFTKRPEHKNQLIYFIQYLSVITLSIGIGALPLMLTD